MKTFTLEQLLIDAMTYGPDGLYIYQFHFLIENLIGSTEYRLLSDYPYARVRFIPVDQDTTLTLRLS